MARAALKLGVREVAELAGVSPNTVSRVEADQASNSATLQALQRALEAAGVEFIPENGGGAGVRLKKATVDASIPVEDLNSSNDE